MESERAGQSKYGPITEDEVNAAQTAWCDALVTIGQVYNKGGDYEAVADRLIAGNPKFPEDKGFALKRWVKVATITTRQKTVSRSTATSPSRWATSI
jgi:hypothetical protein